MIARIQDSTKRAINTPNAPQTRQVTRQSMGTQWGHEPPAFQSDCACITLSINRIRWHAASLSPDGNRDICGTLKPTMEQDTHDSEMTHLPHRIGSQRAQRAQRAHAYAPQTHQTPHPNGPDRGQMVHYRVINAPNAPVSDGMRQQPAAKWGRVPTIDGSAHLSRSCPRRWTAAPEIVRSVTGQFQLIEAERVEGATTAPAESTDNRPTFHEKRPIMGTKAPARNLSIIYRRFGEIYRWRLSPRTPHVPEYPQPIRNRSRGYPQREVSHG